ncbi:MAG: LapA family protein [Xanthomonadaceae bacterium]|nr:LapA family protein [Xanthomonadaceae bacterium]MDP2185623.1 LapA family protein [Xanthomonadales bacterium]MDZ4116674.1 LapA family protein [Xanthomonadaceae bacterium]MDZ4376596.1 LapA family protein [Xanthomonadaceae bacterium]
MRVIHALMVLVFILVGASFAALNTAPITVDFYFNQLSANSGFMVLFAMLAGAVLGAIAVIVGGVWPLRRRLKALQRNVAISESSRTLNGPVDAA